MSLAGSFTSGGGACLALDGGCIHDVKYQLLPRVVVWSASSASPATLQGGPYTELEVEKFCVAEAKVGGASRGNFPNHRLN